jgi:hypothetical protein
MFDASVQQFRPNPASAIGRIDQHHSNPCESLAVYDRRRRPAHYFINFRNKTTIFARVQESFPIGFGLIPPGQLLEPHSRGNIVFRHRSQLHGNLIRPFAFTSAKKNSAGKDSAAIPYLPLMFLRTFKYNFAATRFFAEILVVFAQ